MSSTSQTSTRLAWIDILRGVAVIGMIQTHVWNAFLNPSYDPMWWRQEWSFLSGLMAPAFLWIAGYMQGLSIRKAHRDGRPAITMARLKRLGIIVFLAYGLHVPWNYWLACDFSRESWRIFLQADILQCMTVTLALLLLMGRASARWFDLLTLLGIGFAVFCAPAAQYWQTGCLFLDAFINHETGSLFPLFPWFGFCAAGCLASRWEVSWKTYLTISLVLIALGMWLTPHGYVQPSFFFKRLGWLWLVTTAIWLVSPLFAPRWLLLAGRESLLIYVVHLLLIYSILIDGVPLDRWIGRTQSLAATTMIFFVILIACMLLAWGNERHKQRAKPRASV